MKKATPETPPETEAAVQPQAPTAVEADLVAERVPNAPEYIQKMLRSMPPEDASRWIDKHGHKVQPSAVSSDHDPVWDAPGTREMLGTLQRHRDMAAAAQRSRDKLAALLEPDNPNPSAEVIAQRAEDARLSGIIANNTSLVDMLTTNLAMVGFIVSPNRDYRRYAG